MAMLGPDMTEVGQTPTRNLWPNVGLGPYMGLYFQDWSSRRGIHISLLLDSSLSTFPAHSVSLSLPFFALLMLAFCNSSPNQNHNHTHIYSFFYKKKIKTLNPSFEKKEKKRKNGFEAFDFSDLGKYPSNNDTQFELPWLQSQP